MGDGRVVTLGTINKFDIQLKGFGQTVIAKQYFKHKDGKLSQSEYLSEIEVWNKIKRLNIPTYEILGVVLLNGKCKRKFYGILEIT